MIISRVLKVNEKGTLKEYDYAGCDDDENKKIADILK